MILNKIVLRNGFGFDIELVNHLPIWVWFDDADPDEDSPDVGVFEGFVIQLPFIKILIGRLL